MEKSENWNHAIVWLEMSRRYPSRMARAQRRLGRAYARAAALDDSAAPFMGRALFGEESARYAVHKIAVGLGDRAFRIVRAAKRRWLSPARGF